jgi:MoaA/NifB/PqqE/SkfB family radical SAM enzyme
VASPQTASQRGGKCGLCEYQKVCGGFALTGDYIAGAPRCVYRPHLAEAVAG